MADDTTTPDKKSSNRNVFRRGVPHTHSNDGLMMMQLSTAGGGGGGSGDLKIMATASGSSKSQRHPTTAATNSTTASAPRSGNIIPSMLEISVRDKSDAAAKRRFRVQVPTRLVRYVMLVFLVLPLVAFFWKETHLHGREDNHAHYKPERYNHINTEDVLSHLLDDKSVSPNATTSTITTKETRHESIEGKVGNESKVLDDDLSKAEKVKKIANLSNTTKTNHQNETDPGASGSTEEGSAADTANQRAKNLRRDRRRERNLIRKQLGSR